MAPAAIASVDQTAEMIEKMNLGAKTKSQSGLDVVKKSNGVNVQVPPYERSTTPMQSEYMDQSMCYPPSSYPYYYGAYDSVPAEWTEYMRCFNQEGVELPAGVYGENGLLMYPHSYGYAPFQYSPATSPGPDGPQQYRYSASYHPSLTSNGAPFTPNSTTAKHGDLNVVAADKKHKPLLESANHVSQKLNDSQIPAKSPNPNLAAKGVTENGRASLSGYQYPKFGYDTSRLPLWADGQLNNSAVTAAVASNNTASRNQMLRPQNHLMSRPMTGNGANNGFMTHIFSNPARSGYGCIPSSYDSRINGHGWMRMDGKYGPRGQGNSFYGYGNTNADGLNELNRGPRSKRSIKVFTSVVKDQNEPAKTALVEGKETLSDSPLAEQYNLPDFAVDYSDAKFFIIKSYSEDDVHKSIKYNVWASTPNGNKKLDGAYKQAHGKAGSCPVFLFFSVNASGQFVGLAEMVSSVDFDKSLEYWQQDKWNGCFSLKWHIVKDVPSTLLKHIILDNNENKPVTNSRDTQEVKLEQGLQMLKIFKDHFSRTSILDDFTFYESRQKAIQEKKVRLQFQKQVWEGKNVDLMSQQDASKDGHTVNNPSKTVAAVHSKGDAKMEENGSVTKSGYAPLLA